MTNKLDLLIANGRILDGTGNPAYNADIGIVAGEIAVMGHDISKIQAERVIDADVVIFDPETIIDNSTFDDSMQPPAGIHWVIVSGELAVENGTVVRATSGQVLRRG